MDHRLIAFNIVNKNIICQKDTCPLLYYSAVKTTKSNIGSILKADDDFKDYIKTLSAITYETYLDININYFIYNFNNSAQDLTEAYDSGMIALQDIFSIEDFGEEYYIKYIYNICVNLYKLAYHKDYINSQDIQPSAQVVIDIYNEIKKKYAVKFSKTTFINYIREQVNKTYPVLSQHNKDIIINKLNNIIND